MTDGPTWCRRRATLIPPRRSHRTRFHGVLSSAHRWRARVVPKSSPAPPPPVRLARRLDWASLLRRVFGEDVTTCPRCGDPLIVLAFITAPDVTARILGQLGIVSEVLPIAPARAPPVDELELAFDHGCAGHPSYARSRGRPGPLVHCLPPSRCFVRQPTSLASQTEDLRAADTRTLPSSSRPPRRNHASIVLSSPMILAHGLDWASLLRRVLGDDVTRCPRCSDRLRVLAFLTRPDVTATILAHLGLASVVPPIAPARAPPAVDGHELALAFDDL